MTQIGLEREAFNLNAKRHAELARKLLQSLKELSEVKLETLWAKSSTLEFVNVQPTF
ncbi:MAG: hypothetical protein HC933_14155 [Pleurocapsa sp. SU_196_0]|nr:hypothetical protein [Pleurocapsa sp. SU_196_0]